jgi:hypothetical protein
MRTFEVIDDNHKYILTRAEDRILIQFWIEDNLWDCQKTYLWYFDVDDFDEITKIDKDKLVSMIYRQLYEKYFQPMPYDQVKRYVKTLFKNTIYSIDKAIDSVTNRIPDFTPRIKNVAGINAMFDGKVKLILDEQNDKLSTYYSLIETEAGHMPVPIFLHYLEVGPRSDEEQMSIVKNVLYFIKGFEEKIPESERDWESELTTDVRGAKSELFKKAVVLYNKIPKEKRHADEDEEEYYVDEECPEYSLPDGMGYCRDFDYEDLMRKSEDELANEIVESLTKIRNTMAKIREDMLESGF